MKNWIKRIVAFALVAVQLIVIPTVSAGSLENIQNEKATVEKEVNQLQANLNASLEEVSNISIALDELNKEIEVHQDVITETEATIVDQEKVVEVRYEYTAEQLKSMQTSEFNQNVLIHLLQAESISEFFNTIVTASRLAGASSQHLEEAQNEYQKLNTLKEELVTEQEELDQKQVKVVDQKQELDEKVAELKTTLASSQEELNVLKNQEVTIREEIAAKQAAARVAAEKQTASVSVSSSPGSSTPAEPAQKAAAPKAEVVKTEAPKTEAPKENNAGQWMSVQATGYSTQQPGLSTHTATGIDLRVNSRVIAVDPRIIPLGSLVEVQGMGVYVAGDTGGAIKGRIIDIHYPTVSQALSWGRRNVNIRIIN